MPTYYVTVCGGLEAICEDEIRERLSSVQNLRSVYGRVFFNYDGRPADLFALRSVNHCHIAIAELHGVPSGREALPMMRDWIAGQSLDEPVGIALRLRDLELEDVPSFRVTAQRGGEHDFHSPEIAAALGEGVVRSYGWPVDLEGYDVEIKATLADDWLVLGVALTDASLHKRNRLHRGHAALKPSIAYCLIRLAAPQPGHVVVDPMCGVGTIPIEAALAWHGLTVVGGEISQGAVRRAQGNAKYAEAEVQLVRWDARRMPLREGSVDVVVCNLPWGRRSGSHRINRRLYPRVFAEIARILRPGGRAVLLTLERRLTRAVLAEIPGLALRTVRGINVSNLRPSVYELHKIE